MQFQFCQNPFWEGGGGAEDRHEMLPFGCRSWSVLPSPGLWLVSAPFGAVLYQKQMLYGVPCAHPALPSVLAVWGTLPQAADRVFVPEYNLAPWFSFV